MDEALFVRNLCKVHYRKEKYCGGPVELSLPNYSDRMATPSTSI